MKVKKTLFFCILALIALVFPVSVSYGQSLTELSDQQPQAEVEKFQDQPVLNMEAVQNLVQHTQPVGAFPQDTSKYTLGANDIVEITVMRHPEVSGQFPINPEGKIQYNFVGDILISGMTKDEAAKVVANRLTEYIINPEVSVKIVGYNSKVVYVVGEVGAPGKIFMRGDTISIREALVQAGLPQLSGVLKKSYLITPSEDGKPKKQEVNVYALMYEGDLREDLIMKPGDVLFIPPTLMTKALRAVTPITAPVGNVAGTARTVVP